MSIKQVLARAGMRPLGWLAVCAAAVVGTALVLQVTVAAHGVSSRSLITNCMRPPVEFATLPDLGNVVVGVPFTRQITVKFGYRPHTFSFGATVPSDTGITISSTGLISGTIGTAGEQDFDVVVTDNHSPFTLPGASQGFKITAVDKETGTTLHYVENNTVAADGTQSITLPIAVAHEPYSYTLQLNGGDAPFDFALATNPGQKFLPDGLAFNFDTHEIQGTPLAATPMGQPAQFTIIGSDSHGRSVIGLFSLDIEPGTIGSQIVSAGGKLTLKFGQDNGRDALDLTMIVDKTQLNNAGVRKPSDLLDLGFSMTFGGLGLPPANKFNADGSRTGNTTESVTGKFDASGSINQPKHQKVVGDLATQPKGEVQYSITLDPATGKLTAHFVNLTLIRTLAANFNSFANNGLPIVPVNVKVFLPKSSTSTSTSDFGDTALDNTDVLQFHYVRHDAKGTGRASKNERLAPAGIFLINKVTGTISLVPVLDAGGNPVTDGNGNVVKEDRLFLHMTGFLRQPNGAPIVPLTGDKVDVLLKALCLGEFPASGFTGIGNKLVFTNDDPSAGLAALIIDNKKGTVTIDTNGINAHDLTPLGEELLIAGEPLPVPVTITISGADPNLPTFDGQTSVTLFRKGDRIQSK